MIEITSDAIERVGNLAGRRSKRCRKSICQRYEPWYFQSEDTGNKAGKNRICRKWRSTDESNQNKYNQSQHGNLAGFVSFSGVKIPLYKFKVTPTKPGTGKQVRGGGQKRRQRDTV